MLLFSAALFPMWFVSSLYMQQVLGLSPFHAGITFLPMTLAILVIASRAGKLVSAFGVRTVLGSGLVMMTVGLLLFTKINSSGSAWVYVAIPGVLTAAGIAMSIVPSTIAATQGAKEGQAGLASGLVNTSRQVGGGLGLVVLITLATQHSSNLIGDGFQVNDALTRGFRLAYFIAAGLCAVAALMTFLAAAGPGRGAVARLAALRAGRRRRAARLRRPERRLRRQRGRAARPVHDRGRLQLPHRALAAPADHQARPAGAGLEPRARLHPRRELLRPEQTADPRPERPDGPRPRPAAGLVPAGARRASSPPTSPSRATAASPCSAGGRGR